MPAAVQQPVQCSLGSHRAALFRCFVLYVPDRRFGLNTAALTPHRFFAVDLPVAGNGAARKGFPGLGPVAECVTVPGLPERHRWQTKLVPNPARSIHEFAGGE